MFKNNIYNIDREFDYPTIKGIVIQSLEGEALKNTANILHNIILKIMIIPIISTCLLRLLLPYWS
jgi:hypothetical protein